MKIALTLLLILLFNSCMVFESILGLDDCNYPSCDRPCIDNCNYCIIHCDKHNVPDDFNSRIEKSLDKQIEPYKESNRKLR